MNDELRMVNGLERDGKPALERDIYVASTPKPSDAKFHAMGIRTMKRPEGRAPPHRQCSHQSSWIPKRSRLVTLLNFRIRSHLFALNHDTFPRIAVVVAGLPSASARFRPLYGERKATFRNRG